MKVIELLDMVSEYQRVSIYPTDELEWGNDNPYTLDGKKVRELTWCFVRDVANRIVVRIGSDADTTNDEQYNKTFLKIEYR